jgi:hypothetical protein
MRRMARIRNDCRALARLSGVQSNISSQLVGPFVILRYVNTPGLLETNRGIEVCECWEVGIFLPPRYPIDGPVVRIASAGQTGKPFHPNVSPVFPHMVCCGRHMPELLLDELARRIERMILLMPGSVMTDERDALNARACMYVRRLTRIGTTPLRQGQSATIELPQIEQGRTGH